MPVKVAPAGWALLVLAVLGWSLGLTLHWTELLLLGTTSTLLLVVGLVLVLLPRPATASVSARPARTSVGSTTTLELALRAGAVPLLSPLVRLEGQVESGLLRLPSVRPGGTTTESVELLAENRGVYRLGPVRHLRSDPLGLFRRTRLVGEGSTLWVRPRVVVPEEASFGGVFDLEGLPSEQLSASDLAFHSLRAYVPGDDLRNVHWRSSAKASTLLVRQYVESRTLHAAVVVDDDPAAYADAGELETAVSVGASLAIRALDDGFEVDLACGDHRSAPLGRESLLDDTCTWSLGAPGSVGVEARAAQVSRSTSAIGVGIVVSGSTCDLERLVAAGGAFGRDARRIAVRVDPAATSRVHDSHGVRVLEVRRLEDLPRLMTTVTP